MYTLTIGVPFRRQDTRRCEVASDWGRSLLLLRDTMQGKFGPIVVAAPEMPSGHGHFAEQHGMVLNEREDGIQFLRLGGSCWRAREFWLHYRSISAQCNRLARDSQVVHDLKACKYAAYAGGISNGQMYWRSE